MENTQHALLSTLSMQYICTLSTHYLHRCHPWTGQCLCKPGYSGAHCHRPCPVYTYGPGCEQVKYFYVVTNIFVALNTANFQVCSCENFAHCDPRDGACLCSPGWLGPRCEKPCRSGNKKEKIFLRNILKTLFPGKYGAACQYDCKCQNGATCEHTSGKCECRPGHVYHTWQKNFLEYSNILIESN